MTASPDFKIVDLDHIVLRVKDVERAAAFYGDVLGLEVFRLEEYRSGDLPFPCARVNDHTIIDLLPWPDEEPVGDGHRNLDHFCMVVEGIDMAEFATHLKSQGVTVQEDRSGRRSGAQGMADSIYIKDTEGNIIELRRY
ncbi:MAG: VOC family protein [Chloroflexi bacterium]|nr:VOC family protein [Chloroflexota bacterium]